MLEGISWAVARAATERTKREIAILARHLTFVKFIPLWWLLLGRINMRPERQYSTSSFLLKDALTLSGSQLWA
jgi:hypothetical protein